MERPAKSTTVLDVLGRHNDLDLNFILNSCYHHPSLGFAKGFGSDALMKRKLLESLGSQDQGWVMACSFGE